MIELAPRHKIGLPLTNPVMIASGFGGYGDAYQRLIDLSLFGAIVTQPITLRPQRGAAQPRLVETRAGFILNTGQQNPGVRKVLQRYSKIWARLQAPVIAHLPAAEPDDLRRTAGALGNTAVAGLELGLPEQSYPEEVSMWLRALQQGCELPILVKLPLGSPIELAEAAARAYADALVVSQPPPGTAYASNQSRMVTGPLYGPGLQPLVLHDLLTLTDLGLPLVASGGIHGQSDLDTFLEAGASAVQIDSLLFIDPKGAEAIAKAASASE